MNPKDVTDKTKKYSGVVKSVQKAQKPPEEPRITKEQVTEAFKSFNIPLNARNHDDIAYWTTKGQSEKPKMIEELHKQRTELNQKEDEFRKSVVDKKKLEDDKKKQISESKETLPRLSDNDIKSLHDEYGLPSPDPEWARNHLPNDPKKIRSILEVQRKTADDMLKKHAKNTVNAMPEVPKVQSGAPMMGMGGPMSSPMQGPMQQPTQSPTQMPNTPATMPGDMMGGGDQSTTPFFIGDSAVVRIVNPANPNASTLWLVDPQKKVLQPFISEQAFENAFNDPQAAKNAIVTLSSKDLGPGGALDGFELLKGSQGVGHDGKKSNVEFSKAQIQNRYGKQSNPDAENKSMSLLDGVLGGLSKKK